MNGPKKKGLCVAGVYSSSAAPPSVLLTQPSALQPVFLPEENLGGIADTACGAGLLATGPLGLRLSEEVFTSSPLFKDNFTWYRILGWQWGGGGGSFNTYT